MRNLSFGNLSSYYFHCPIHLFFRPLSFGWALLTYFLNCSGDPTCPCGLHYFSKITIHQELVEMSVTLASGDVPVATATVTKSLLSGQQPGSADIATMTFYSKANDPNLLYATNVVSGHNEIKPSSWVQGFVWYWWNNQTGSTNLVWNTVSTGGIPIPINAPGSSTSNPMTSSAPATNPASPTAATTTQSSVTSGSATETSSQSSIPAKSSSSGGGLSTGAIAGVAIGCAIAGALIAALLVWFCMKRKRSAGTRDSEASAIALMNRHEKGPAATAKTLSLSSASPVPFAFESGLSQPLEDKAITGEISKISNLIKNHVQSYYHTKSVSPGMIDYDDLQALGSNLPVSIGTLSTLLGNAATREIALRFCIAWIVTSRIGLYDSPNTTFLPLELSECLQAISSVDQGSRGMVPRIILDLS
jgi:hypothetical protein